MQGESGTAEEEEEELRLHHTAAASSVDHQDLPIMHWDDLSQRIAELEKQEQDRRERSKRGAGVRPEESQGGLWRDVWEEEEEEEEEGRRCRAAVVPSRLHRNLQLCFINDSDSEEEEAPQEKVTMGTGGNGCHATGLKQEVVTALRTLRDKLLAEQRQNECPAGSGAVSERTLLERRELQERSTQQLCSLRAALQQDVHALSSELVAHLLVRDQLRTKQDAMLLDVQDLT